MERNKMILSAGALVALIGGGVAMTQLEHCNAGMCTMEARPSVVVKFIDETGAPVSADSVWFEHTPSDANETFRASVRGECADEECTEWVVGRELTGLFTVHGTVCGQQFHERGIEVGMTDDDCHVDTEEVVFVAEPCPADDPATGMAGAPEDGKISCTAKLVPSVTVYTTEGPAGEPAAPEAVWWAMKPNTPDADLSQAPLPDGSFDEGGKPELDKYLGYCIDEGCTRWNVGWDEPGHYWVWVRSCGEVVMREVDVTMEDRCHVETQELWVPLPDARCLKTG